MTNKTLITIPNNPNPQLRHQIVLYLLGFLRSMNMKQGYARVTGSANPPINAAKLGKKGSATDIKNAKHPNEALSPALSHRGHGLFNLRVYLDSRLSKTGIAYIWNEVRLLSTMSRLINPRRTFEVSCPWYLCKASNIPPFAGICFPCTVH